MKPKLKNAFMKVANTFAELSTAKKLNVGCIIVKEDRIISIGYNGMPSGWTNDCEIIEKPHWMTWDPVDDYSQCRLITKPEVLHAEANAITKLAKSSESGLGATLFVTHEPCIECAKLIYQSGIDTVYYENEYHAGKGSGLQFLIQSGVTVEKL